ncbi:MAG: PulJ/GspJ family protein [Candidatus Fervidibacter sp.]|uniref:PulJ/GspJ family protein n=1 Tax=Candidatus Fervidibacter sp. TaxID=3100871 RepID=UPI00404A0E49
MVKRSTKNSKLRKGTRQIACVWWQKVNIRQRQFNRPPVASRWSLRFQPSNPNSLAFTLTELLVAIAILSIMFTLLFIPMTQAFDNARRGRVMAELQNAADYALEIMVRELTQATEVMPQERVAPNGQPLNLFDELDTGDDDTYSRVDFVVCAVQGDRLVPQNWQQAYTVITYYLRRMDSSRGFQYLEIGGQPSNRRQIFRAQWIPDQNIAPEPNQRDPQERWIVNGAWIMPDLSQLQPANPPQGGLISHNSLTPPDIDVADLRFTVERRAESDERARKPVAVVIEMTLRKPTPGARAKRDPNTGALMDEPDAPSLFIRRRVKVVLENVQ